MIGNLSITKKSNTISVINFTCLDRPYRHYIISCASILQPIYNLAKDVLIDYDVASCDAATLQVLQEPGRPAKLKSYVYCMRGGPPNKSVILYDYNALDHKQCVSDWFEGFKGYLHVDADPCAGSVATL